MKGLISAAIAIAIGILVLLGYFVAIPALTSLRATLVDWAVILAAVALFIGVFSLLSTHVDKIRKKQKGGFYSLILITSLLATLLLGLLLGPNHQAMHLLFNSIQLPVETSLMALLAVTLVYASIRLLRRRNNLLSALFLATALLILLGTAPLPWGEIPLLGDIIRPIIAQVPAAAGARGILLGVALGTLTTGLRILFGADRPYGGK